MCLLSDKYKLIERFPMSMVEVGIRGKVSEELKEIGMVMSFCAIIFTVIQAITSFVICPLSLSSFSTSEKC
ncbi:hypothetical protein Golax_019459 [Gossypium laxum]|uniref:Uncharacterized protein n=1 Tax=Gossypium laxum TaxID=34288 RepID=A0A7J8Z741_9ROSI|nr:hypothetical protein [Gossypium laxum]